MHYGPSTTWAFISLMLTFGLILLTVALVIGGRRGLYWRSGVVLGLMIFVLGLPAQVFIVAHLNAQALINQLHLPPGHERAAAAAIYLLLIISLTVSVILIPWHMLVYEAAAKQWERFGPEPFAILQRSGRAPWSAIGRAAAFGLAAGALSAVIFKLLGVGVSDVLNQYGTLSASAEKATLWVRLPIAALAVTAAALAEELTYRGMLYGWLLRLLKGRRGVALAAVLTSAVWAAAHAPNTDSPLIKCAQVFVLGLFFCEFARRWCLEAAMAAHVGLNLAALLVGAAIG